jgi:hypothetical protein
LSEGKLRDPRQPKLLQAKQLIIEQSAQRDVRSDRVKVLAENWDYTLAEVPTVTPYMEELYHVLEGQNRSVALESLDPEATLWCIVIENVEPRERPQKALDISGGRRVHSAYDKFYLGYNAGHPHELAAVHALSELGLRVGKGTSQNSIAAAGVVSRLIHGGRRTAEMGAWLVEVTFSALLDAYPSYDADPHRWDSLLIGALGQVIARNPNLRYDRLVKKLAERRAEHWLRDQDSGGGDSTKEEAIGQAIIRGYNRGSRVDRLEW